MLMNQILDSSNSLRDLGERSRPLKRSATVASLPTPPRTQHKRSRSRARSFVSHHDSDDGDSASDHDMQSGYAGRIKRAKSSNNSRNVSDEDECSEDESPDRKKRRTVGVLPGHDEEEEDENAFWTGRSSPLCAAEREKKETSVNKTEESSPSPAMLRYRVKAPVSPPPSRRQPSIHPARTAWPKRDSPNNPFLVSPDDKAGLHSEWDSSDDEEVVGEAREREETPTPIFEEKPTITYVFRGQKATFHNPLYGLTPDVIAASKLPIDHPDYEAAEACPPKKLFSARKVTVAKTHVASKDGLRAGAVIAERDEPARRAMGPLRST